MANEEQLKLLLGGVSEWNLWRDKHPSTIPDLTEASLNNADLSGADLSGADLSGADLSGADLSGALLMDANLIGVYLNRTILHGITFRNAKLNKASLSGADLARADLSGANLSGADLARADLSGAYLSGADLARADLSGANLSEANLSGANLARADLSGADLSGANLSGANLSRAILVETNMSQASLIQCSIYGIAAWKIDLEGTKQRDLVITPEDEPIITVDDLELAQLIYLLLNNAKVRQVIDTITRKTVLILGRFTAERKAILDALREALRQQGYVPILFDFDRPQNRDFTETITILASLSRFVIADLTDASSIPYELASIVTRFPIAVQPLTLISESKQEYAMFNDLRKRYSWILPTYTYRDLPDLLSSLQEHIIEPSERKAVELGIRQ